MNSFGRLFRLTMFGESHGDSVGVNIDGCPAGLPLRLEDFLPDLERRKGGIRKGTTPRKEDDLPVFKSGLHNDRTTGAPLTILFENKNTRSGDYEKQRDVPRPGHADFVAHEKFGGFEDFRGGGHFSARLTVALVAAGVIAKKLLASAGQMPEIAANESGLKKNGPVLAGSEKGLEEPAVSGEILGEAEAAGKFDMPDWEKRAGLQVKATILEIGGEQDLEAGLQKAIDARDTIGGIVECRVSGLPVGLGEPFFDSAESLLSHAVFAIPAIRGIEFGTGFAAARMFGSQHNDAIEDLNGRTRTNHAGGVVGGITNGNELVFRVAVKPTSSTPKQQQTLNWSTGAVEAFSVKGRHDLCIALRVPVVLEAVTAIVLADLLLLEQHIKRIIP